MFLCETFSLFRVIYYKEKLFVLDSEMGTLVKRDSFWLCACTDWHFILQDSLNFLFVYYQNNHTL